MSIPLEVCIDSALAAEAAQAAFAGGASCIELCSQMQHDGLTPDIEEIKLARAAFKKPGLMVMIRPRAGDFSYTVEEQQQMIQSIQMAKDSGADGVVFGALRENQIDAHLTRVLTQQAKSLGLSVTFHRAFDAVDNRSHALKTLIQLGVDRVLTSGRPWKSKEGALEGLPVIRSLLEQANDRIEIIIGGGINRSNIKDIIGGLKPLTNVSIHVYSGAQEHGVTTARAIKTLQGLIQ